MRDCTHGAWMIIDVAIGDVEHSHTHGDVIKCVKCAKCQRTFHNNYELNHTGRIKVVSQEEFDIP